MTLAILCDRQGQSLFYPPNVKGWDGGRAWVSSADAAGPVQLGERLRLGEPLAGDRALRPRRLGEGPSDRPGKRRRPPRGPPAPGRPRSRGAFPGDPEPAETAAPDGVRKALQILLNCPEFQLA